MLDEASVDAVAIVGVVNRDAAPDSGTGLSTGELTINDAYI